MIFHEDKDFADAIQKAGEYFKLRPIFIEKDYWVTFVLKNLSQSEYVNAVIFKGGTSLSKAYNCIDRFSEDIDLALLKETGINDNQLKKIMKGVEAEISKGLEYMENHAMEEKKGRNRRTFYNYPKALSEKEFGEIKDNIQIELNTFTNPVPHQKIEIESYLAYFLRKNQFESFIEKYALHPFELNVLTRERTFFEKLLSLIRLSYNGVDELKRKIRHFYDLHRLYNQEDLKETILTDKSFELVDWVISDDELNNTFAGEWLNHPLSESPLFSSLDKFWGELSPVYARELKDLSWSKDIPSSKEIMALLNDIKSFLQAYDKKNSPRKGR